jgi:hypothetical protein
VAFRLPAGTYKFRADHMNSQFWATAAVAGNATNDIALSTGGGTFSLTVQKESTAALAGIPVYVFSTSGAYLGLTATTDADGQVSFDHGRRRLPVPGRLHGLPVLDTGLHGSQCPGRCVWRSHTRM